MKLSLLSLALVVTACGGAAEAPVATGDDANLTEATAARLGVPLEVLSATFYVKPSPIDQSGLGVLLAPGAAFARGATSQALPRVTTLDDEPFAALPATTIALGDDETRLDALVDYDGATDGTGARLVGRTPPPLLDPALLRAGMRCRVLGSSMDMYASGPPEVMSLEADVERVDPVSRGGVRVLAKSLESTGGDGTLLVCDGKLAGVQAGAGSQGTYHEFRGLDATLVRAFAEARDDACRRSSRCP